MLPFSARRLQDAENRRVVRLRAAAGEDNLAGPRVKQSRHLLAGFLYPRFGALPEPVDR